MNNNILFSLLHGANITGTFIEGYHYVEEMLPINKSEEAFKFCKWIDEKIGGAGTGNIHMLYKAFKNPNDENLQKEANELRNKIAYLRSL